jgi:cytochrome bd-type quinol oxidase subunit 2
LCLTRFYTLTTYSSTRPDVVVLAFAVADVVGDAAGVCIIVVIVGMIVVLVIIVVSTVDHHHHHQLVNIIININIFIVVIIIIVIFVVILSSSSSSSAPSLTACSGQPFFSHGVHYWSLPGRMEFRESKSRWRFYG